MSPPPERESRGASSPASSKSTTTADNYRIDDSGRQLAAIGTASGLDELFVGALMFSTVAEVREVAHLVEPGDFDEPAATVFSAVAGLAARGVPPSPQLVADDLKRRGLLTRRRAVWLHSAVVSGACSSAAYSYAAAVVSESLRRQAESFGQALVSVADTAAEDDVATLAGQAATRIRVVAERLEKLRGER